jgi:squalene-hopene/tetraprenyl-beta-curcumene cyclase
MNSEMTTTLETFSPPSVAISAFEQALDRAQSCLLEKQYSAGYWVGELQGDSILESEYILLKFILEQESDARLVKIANYLRGLQQPHGGWGLFPGSPADLSGTVKAYFALKLMGDSPNAPHMRIARQVIYDLGGAEKCNSFTKFYFAALGQISYDACPSIPPEVVLLPKWFYFNLYHVSAWTRTMVLPLGIVTTYKYVRKLPAERGIAELYIDREAGNRVADPMPRGIPLSWRDLFLRIDSFLKIYNESPIESLRAKAMKQAEAWLLEHSDNSEGLGAIFPPMVYILIVFRILGYPDDHPRVMKAHEDLEDFFIEEGDTIRIQPCVSPVWDTGLALHALNESNLPPESPAAKQAVQWLLAKECRVASDWLKNCPGVQPSGWFFEFENPHYPDVDDTAAAIMALRRAGGPEVNGAVQRGLNWLLAMQNSDGGWAAFDRTEDRPILELIPFADHNAMQDPSCPDITGRVFESIGACGIKNDHPAVRAGTAQIQKTQDPRGSWWGRWGVNHVYGTWQVLTGLRAVGQDMNAPFVRKAADWLRSVQKPDGSFGETAESYHNADLIGKGPSTPSQTAWGAMGMLAALGPNDPAVKKAIDWLVEHQGADGNWREDWYTGTGFPKVFYLKYHLYRLYFPLTALSRYRRRLQQINGG